MYREIISFGCSFTRHSHSHENPLRKNKSFIPNRGRLDVSAGRASGTILMHDTSYTIEASQILGNEHRNFAVGGSGVRDTIYTALNFVQTNPVDNVFLTIGISNFTRFDFVKLRDPYHPDGFTDITRVSNTLPKEIYAKYYDRDASKFELLTLIEMAGDYLTKKNIPHVFINTLNNEYSIKNIVNTFMFPTNTEYWTEYIHSYDSTYRMEHPNFNDHVVFGKLLANYLKHRKDI